MSKRSKGMKHRPPFLLRELRVARQALGPRISGKAVNSTVSKPTRTRRRYL